MAFPSTIKQGIITLIPKSGKEPQLLDNLRPITLLNTDYKTVTHSCANRLKTKQSPGIIYCIFQIIWSKAEITTHHNHHY